MSQSQYFIIIDNYKFNIIGKSINDNDPEYSNYYQSATHNLTQIEDRNKLRIESEDLTTGNKISYSLYTSVSEMFCWRLCLEVPHKPGTIDKFDNYIQATLIDLRLQKYIWDNFELFPFIERSVDNIKSNKISIFSYNNNNLNKRNIIKNKENIETLKIIEQIQDAINESKSIINENLEKIEIFVQEQRQKIITNGYYNYRDILRLSTPTLENIIDFYNELIIYYNNQINYNNEFICDNEEKIQINKDKNERYKEQLEQINPNGIINCYIGDRESKNYIDKRMEIIENLNIKNFYDFFQIVDLYNNPIIIPDLIIPNPKNNWILNIGGQRNAWLTENKIEYLNYNKKYGNKHFYVSIYGIKIKKKRTNKIIVAQIIDFTARSI